MSRRSQSSTCALVAVLALVIFGAAWPAGAQATAPPPGPPTYRPPTTAPVLDTFRPPPEPWLAGNRGIEYGTEPGSTVTAIGPGTVTFAGPVADRLVVVVTHPDGLRSSYVGLTEVLVDRGAQVAAGAPVGAAGDRLHLGVRRGETYVDPASLWGTVVGGGRAVLVPERGGGREGGGLPAPSVPPGRTGTLPPRSRTAGPEHPVAAPDGRIAAPETGRPGAAPGGWLGTLTAGSPWR